MFAFGVGAVIVASAGTGYWYWKNNTYTNENNNNIFNIPLNDIDEKYIKDGIPIVIYDCLNALKSHVKEEGIMRLTGEIHRAKELEALYEKGENPDLSIEFKHTPVTLMKNFFNQLPEPLLTFNMYNDWINLEKSYKEINNDNIWCEKANELLKQLPERNRRLLGELLNFLVLINEYSSINLMNTTNLGTVIAPSLCYPSSDYPMGKMITELSNISLLFSHFIRLYSLLVF